MDFSSPLNIILNQGLLGAIIVILIYVIWWMQKRFDHLLEKYDVKSEAMYEQIISIKDVYNQTMKQSSDADRAIAEQLSHLATTYSAIAANVEQLVYRRGSK